MWEIDIPRTFFNQEKYELLIGIGSPSADGQNDSRKSHWLCNEKSHVYHLEPNTLVNYTNYQHSSITHGANKGITRLGFILSNGELGFVLDAHSLIHQFKIDDDTFKQGIYPLMFLRSVDGIINIILYYVFV